MDSSSNNQYLPPYYQQPNRRPRRKPKGQDPRRYGRGQSQAGRGTHQQQPSTSIHNNFHLSNNQSDPSNPPNFQHPQPKLDLVPWPVNQRHMAQQQVCHITATVWKSDKIKEEDEYQRILKKVRYIAPEFVRSELFPQTVDEWRKFKLGRVQDQLEQKEKDTKEIARRIEAADKIPPRGRTVKSAFGPGGKVLHIAGSPVLAMPTIWSSDHTKNINPDGSWPTQAEMLMHGDNRDMTTSSYRSLPPPRQPAGAVNQSYQEQPIIISHPMDEVEPEFTQGPRYPDYVEENTKTLDENPVFNGYGHRFLGESLMKDIGPKQYRIRAEEKGRNSDRGTIQPVRQQHGPKGGQPVPTIMLNGASPPFFPPTGAQNPQRGDATGHVVFGGIAGAETMFNGGSDSAVQVPSGYGGGYERELASRFYGYGQQMPDGSVAYRQQDGSWLFVPDRTS